MSTRRYQSLKSPSFGYSVSRLNKRLISKLSTSCRPADETSKNALSGEDTLPSVIRISKEDLDSPCTALRVLWIGHASTLIQFPTSDPSKPFTIATDILTTSSCSPLGFPRRRLEAACAVEDLPEVHAVLVSHSHYDHASKHDIKSLNTQQGRAPHFVGPSEMDKWFRKVDIDEDRSHSLPWWSSLEFDTDFNTIPKEEDLVGQKSTDFTATLDFGLAGGSSIGLSDFRVRHYPQGSAVDKQSEKDTINAERPKVKYRVTSLPASHNSGRDFLLRDKGADCASYMIEQLGDDGRMARSVFFGGDTGVRSVYSDDMFERFLDVASYFASPDICLLPIASGSLSSRFHLPDWLVQHLHALPMDSVDLFKLLTHFDDDNYKSVGASLGVAMHHSTFDSKSGSKRTIRQMRKATGNADVSMEGVAGGFIVPNAGVWVSSV